MRSEELITPKRSEASWKPVAAALGGKLQRSERSLLQRFEEDMVFPDGPLPLPPLVFMTTPGTVWGASDVAPGFHHLLAEVVAASAFSV
jgi:hypothetical protein